MNYYPYHDIITEVFWKQLQYLLPCQDICQRVTCWSCDNKIVYILLQYDYVPWTWAALHGYRTQVPARVRCNRTAGSRAQATFVRTLASCVSPWYNIRCHPITRSYICTCLLWTTSEKKYDILSFCVLLNYDPPKSKWVTAVPLIPRHLAKRNVDELVYGMAMHRMNMPLSCISCVYTQCAEFGNFLNIVCLGLMIMGTLYVVFVLPILRWVSLFSTLITFECKLH